MPSGQQQSFADMPRMDFLDYLTTGQQDIGHMDYRTTAQHNMAATIQSNAMAPSQPATASQQELPFAVQPVAPQSAATPQNPPMVIHQYPSAHQQLSMSGQQLPTASQQFSTGGQQFANASQTQQYAMQQSIMARQQQQAMQEHANNLQRQQGLMRYPQPPAMAPAPARNPTAPYSANDLQRQAQLLNMWRQNTVNSQPDLWKTAYPEYQDKGNNGGSVANNQGLHGNAVPQLAPVTEANLPPTPDRSKRDQVLENWVYRLNQ
ncbi:hypothetical protein F5Y16DRAFT_376427 [Xylariaceae sp. FL0255]|nr:hypothetical protein F5Y16DRAFT_376427 [Xylariaceae sp. FL0255]